MKQFLVFFTIALLLGACSADTTCRKEKIIVLRAEFYSDSIDAQTGNTVVFKVMPIELSVKGVGSDSLLYNAQSDLSTISLPLRADTLRTNYEVSWAGGEGILSIDHTNEETFISFECGCFVYHTLTDVQVAGNGLTSAEIVNQQVTVANETHLHIRIK